MHVYIQHSTCIIISCFNTLFRMCVKVLGDDKSLWEDEIYKFAKNQKLRVSTCMLNH